jgi:hypothetical protein
MVSSEKSPETCRIGSVKFPAMCRWGRTRMDIIGEILAKYIAIGIAAAAAFVIANYALNYNWL